MLSFNKHDARGNVLAPGNICVYQRRGHGLEYCLYKKPVSISRKGEYGNFITENGEVSLKFTSVVVAFDPISKFTPKGKEISTLLSRFYEGIC